MTGNGLIIAVLALMFGILGTSILVRPFDGAFETHQGQRDIELIGETASVITSKVNSRFGEIKIKGRSGTPLIMMARCDHENNLKTGDEVLIISLDQERNAFIVEPTGSHVARAVSKKLNELRMKRIKN